ncbi:MAG TPA: peptidylprolyl isomerase [Rubricoccaceae bacterium]|nr:peptidylprolyl isomerase [Rubricoccaceae bacterium]
MATAQPGDTIRLHYTGRLRDGSVFDSSEGGEPLAFTLGEGEVIPGFERGVVGMAEGEARTIEVPANEAYGDYRAELQVAVDRRQLPPGLEPEVGQRLQVGMEDGGTLEVVVTEVGDDTVTLDANHPLAGEDLVFDVSLVEVRRGRR